MRVESRRELLTMERGMMGPTYLVITGVPDPEGPEASGNLACYFATHMKWGSEPDDLQPISSLGRSEVGLMLAMRAPVFSLGEILITDGEREVAGDGRKPSKWGVECESFADVEAAIERSREVGS